ncbi:MAG: hypothetical protein V4690_01425 [Patescibacteria group bacterium]
MISLSQRTIEIHHLAVALREGWDSRQVFIDPDVYDESRLHIPGWNTLNPGWLTALKRLSELMDIPLSFADEIEKSTARPRYVLRLLQEAEGFLKIAQ